MGMVRNLRRSLVLAAIVAGVLVAAAVTSAAKVDPILLPGASNQGKDCSDNQGAGQTWTQLQIEGNASRTYTSGPLTVTLNFTTADKVFDWSSNIGIDAVIVKGGADGSYMYKYDPPAEETSDTGLQTAGLKDISHINFCYDVDPPAQTGTLAVVKHVDNANGGTASAGDWTMNVAGPTPLSFPGVESPGTKNTVNAGDYTVTESGGPSNYTLTYSGDCDSTGHVNVPAFHDRVCTLTNTAKPGNIVVKKVTNPGGDQQAFTFSPSYGSSFQLADGQQNDSGSLKAGTYSVAETAVSGWDQTSATCDDGSSPSSISLSSGETVTCTFTNTKHGNLIVVKHVSNTHGGSAVASSWSMHVKQNGSDISGSPFAGAESPGTSTEVSAGSYNVSESGGPSGYALTYSGDCSSSGDVTVPAGQTKTCTLTNSDQPATLTVVKHVQNTHGGTASAGDFTMTIDGVTASGGNSFAGAESPGVTKTLTSVGSYNVTESSVPGYTQLSASADCSGTIALGESKTCTITNGDQPATLTVVKHVQNTHGGAASAGDFTMTIDGVTASAGNSFAGAESPGVTKTLTSVGSYNVTESSVPGYTQLSASADCSGTIALGESKTCTITNGDQQGTLIVKKVVVNDNGGTAVASDFSFQVNGGDAQQFEQDGQNDLSVDAGTYTVTEPGTPGYATSYAGCDHVVVAPGQTQTCTITNDDQPGHLIVKKVVVNDNGGTAVASDFSFQVNGGSAQQFEQDGQNDLTVDAGTYTITEPGVTGYTTSYEGCDHVVVAVGQTQTCTVTNDDQPAHLTVVKLVVNDNGGTAVASDFSFQVNGGSAQPFEQDGQNDLTVDAGTYTVTEPGAAGYTTSYEGCEGIQLPVGGTATCTITNDDEPAHLIVKKVVVNDNGGTKTASDFSFQVNGGQPQQFEQDGQNDVPVDAGQYTVTEPGTAGYTTTYQGCDHILLAIGETATCTITNNDVPHGQGSISVSKSADPTSIKEPGGPVTFSVRVTNTSADVNVVITNVVDDKFGDLDDDGGSGCFDVPINLAPGAFASCQFTEPVTGPGGTTHVDTVTASGQDANGNPVSASDSAEVVITPKLIDLVVTKQATSPTKLHGTVHYALTVTNKGPDQATNVQLADPAPAGITYLTATSSQGTCMVAPALVTCSLGTLASGQTVTIAITGRSDTVGSHTNTATVTGAGGRETNPADNTASAVTVTPAPVTPPTPKPKPHPKPCLALNVTPKMIKADGKPDKVVAVVTRGKAHVHGAKVVVKGAGVNRSGRTNTKGKVVIAINPTRAGLVSISTPESQHSCGSRRIGVVGVFLPPVTG